jgi:DNA polymerase III epsilon subunit family exonuclease
MYFGRSRYAVIDVETTGFSPNNDAVVEVACVLVERGRILDTFSSLVNPGRSIPAYATAVHGISDDDVRDAPRLRDLQNNLLQMTAGTTVAAHNASFDLSFLPFLTHRPSLCTLQLARRTFPNAPNFKNQTLRKYLQLDDEPAIKALGAHRALADAMVTAYLLLRCLHQISTEPAVGVVA